MTPALLSALLHLYVAWRIAPALPGAAAPLCFAVLVAASALLIPLSFQARRGAGGWLAWSGMLALGLFSSLFVLTLLRDALLLLAWPFGLQTALPLLQPWSASAVPLAASALTLFGLYQARRTAQVREVEVPIHGLPAALHGFTIAQITDIHVGPTVRRGCLQAIVDTVNSLGADLVAVTGDLVDGAVHELAEHVQPLATLRSRHGSFFVTGNHEYYSGAQGWIAEIERLGLRVLLNEHVVLQHGAAQLVLAGVTDPGAHHFIAAHRSDPHAAAAGAPPDAGLRVLLAHQPRSAAAAALAGFDVQLSGHTHGGQFWPWNFFVPLQQPYTAGLHRLQDLWVYVSRGTGYWGPPKRLGAPSEVTRLRFVTAP